jgi:hypothetical protein
MTLPDERYRAIRQTREFLRDLLDPRKTPKVPKEIRQRASRALRHFPSEYDMGIVANEMTGIFDLPKESNGSGKL